MNRHMSLCGSCGTYVGDAYGEDALISALDSVANPNWLIQNAATLTLSSLINRIIVPPGIVYACIRSV